MFERVLEVRDKPVTASDLSAVLHKGAALRMRKVGVVAIHRGQDKLDEAEARAEAAECGVSVELLTSWESLVRTIVFWARGSELAAVEKAAERTRVRLQELDAPTETVRKWNEKVLGEIGAASD